MIDHEKIEQAVRLLLEGMGEDVNREGLIDTPEDVYKRQSYISWIYRIMGTGCYKGSA